MVFPLEVKQNSSTLRVIAPNRFIRDQIESEYLTLIKETVALKSSNSITEVMLMLPGTPKTTPRKSWNDRLRNNINNDLTFENFVEGKSNQLARQLVCQWLARWANITRFTYMEVLVLEDALTTFNR